jgi:hypothetical protein
VRRLAAETPAPAQDDLVGCWISPRWSRDLLVSSREGWDDIDVGAAGPGGVALVLVARAPALPVALGLAQHVVHGAVAFAAGLGLKPHPDFGPVREQLGELTEPCAITFGRHGRPLYVAGPYDDSIAIMRAIEAAVGSDGFAVAA